MMEKQSVDRILEKIAEHNEELVKHHKVLEKHHQYTQRILDRLKDDVEKLVNEYELLDCWRKTGRELRALQDSFGAVYAEIERLRREGLAAERMDLPRVIDAWDRSMRPYSSVILCADDIEKIQEEEVLQELKQHKGEIDVDIDRRRLVDLEESLSKFKQAIAKCSIFASAQVNQCVERIYRVSLDIQGKITGS